VLTTVSTDDAQYALQIVKRICAEVGPGVPATVAERGRAAIIATELEACLGAGNVVVEEFELAPGAFLGSLPISAVLLLVAALLSTSPARSLGVSPWITAGVAFALSVLALALVVLEFFASYELIDPLFPKRRSVNVMGTLRASGGGEAKRLLLVSGHHDSAPEITWLSLLGYGFLVFAAVWLLGLITTLVLSSVRLAGLISGNDAVAWPGTLGWVLLAFPILPAVVYGLFFTRGRKGAGTVPGAADNLSACGVTVALCRFLVRNPSYVPADAEIRFVTFGSEEAGLRGSRRYVERHLDELRRLDARLLNFETVAYPEIAILKTDVSGFAKHSPEMVKAAVAAAERAGVPHSVKSAGMGTGTDAAPFSRAGLKATALLPFKVPQQMVAFYHQKADRPEVLTIEPLLNVLKLSVEWVRAGGQ
jgi:hypothetical protein